MRNLLIMTSLVVTLYDTFAFISPLSVYRDKEQRLIVVWV